ncbi:MAG: hypothetical protein IT282_10845 [Bacteroidetes bacterium]|nr:hypothetical protein [Bacteroidota bacterium]
MAGLDLILLLAFGTVSLGALAASFWCLRRAMAAATKKDGDIRMFFWTVGMFATLIVSGLSAAYILVPILFGR